MDTPFARLPMKWRLLTAEELVKEAFLQQPCDLMPYIKRGIVRGRLTSNGTFYYTGEDAVRLWQVRYREIVMANRSMAKKRQQRRKTRAV